MGFDDVPTASAIEPALTTLGQPIERLGSEAIEMLLEVPDKAQGAEPPPTSCAAGGGTPAIVF